ncbi:calcium-binding and coiled-coil domain-containing protein 2 isoform X2 [Sardina pilchardus]|uniref:calcium-binding and coiled-coil domain-containing protein 2 isoform X2 n=1 Tax=Sardina pilchardus TaxID=27697 RepID=UPI002E161795
MNESPEAETFPVEMESSTTAFSQVVFVDVPRSYLPNTTVTCCYTLTAGLQPNPRDWIGVFKVGWNTTQNYHTFLWVEPCLDRLGPDAVKQQVVFNEYYLPKDDGDYQFCYVDSNGQVRGASTPFCFENPQDHVLYTSLDNDILVITTQEQTEQMEKEREELRREMEQIKEEKQTLRNELDEKLKEIHSLKLTIEEMKNSKSADTKLQGDESTNVPMEQSCHELDAVSDLKQSQESLEQSSVDGKYGKALQKIDRLKQERKELRATAEKQQTQITQLNSKVKEMEQDQSRLQDNVQLLQVDLKSSQKEIEKSVAETQQVEALKRDLEGLRRENESLNTSLSTLTPQREDGSDTKAQMETLLNQLKETRVQLRQEIQNCKDARRRAEVAEQALSELRGQLEQQAESANGSQSKENILEMKLKEALKNVDDQAVILDLAKEEQEEFLKKIQELETEVDLLKGELARVKPGTPAAPDSTEHSYGSFPSFTDPGAEAQQDSLLYGNPYASTDGASEDTVLKCQHCLIAFPGISREELMAHEESHKVCPICTLICDEMEQPEFEDHVYGHDL